MATTATTEERLAVLEAKDEIRELTGRYCHAVTDGDVDALVDLFCEDGVFQMKRPLATGREALRSFYAQGVGEKTHKPFIQNHVIELLSDVEATGRCSVEIRILQDGVAYTGSGHYLDRYRKEGGRWRFAHRHYHSYHFVPLSEGWKK